MVMPGIYECWSAGERNNTSWLGLRVISGFTPWDLLKFCFCTCFLAIMQSQTISISTGIEGFPGHWMVQLCIISLKTMASLGLFVWTTVPTGGFWGMFWYFGWCWVLFFSGFLPVTLWSHLSNGSVGTSWYDWLTASVGLFSNSSTMEDPLSV